MPASRTDTERAAMVLRRGTGRGGPRALLASDVFDGSLIQRGRTGQTTAKGADGTSECPGGSPHERGAGAQAPDPGTSSRPTNPSACGTQAKGCFRGPGSVDAIFARFS